MEPTDMQKRIENLVTNGLGYFKERYPNPDSELDFSTVKLQANLLDMDFKTEKISIRERNIGLWYIIELEYYIAPKTMEQEIEDALNPDTEGHYTKVVCEGMGYYNNDVPDFLLP